MINKWLVPPAPPRNGRAAAALARINEGAANRAPDGPLRVSLLACAAALRAAARAEGAGRAAEEQHLVLGDSMA